MGEIVSGYDDADVASSMKAKGSQGHGDFKRRTESGSHFSEYESRRVDQTMDGRECRQQTRKLEDHEAVEGKEEGRKDSSLLWV